MGVKVADAFIDLTMPTGNYLRHTAQAKSAFHGFASSVNNETQRMRDNMLMLGASIVSGLTVPLTLGVRKMVMASSEATEMQNRFTVSFGKMAESARVWSKTMERSTQISRLEIERNLSTMNVFLQSAGFAREEAVKWSQAMVALGIDMSSFFDKPIEDMFHAMKSGIAGIPRALVDLGVSLHELTLKEVALNLGVTRNVETMTQQEKQLLRMAQLLKSTELAWGDFLRTHSTFSNLWKQLSSQFGQTAAELGGVLIPAVSLLIVALLPVVKVVGFLAGLFNKLPAPIRAVAGMVILAGVAFLQLMIVIPILVKLRSMWMAVAVAKTIEAVATTAQTRATIALTAAEVGVVTTSLAAANANLVLAGSTIVATKAGITFAGVLAIIRARLATLSIFTFVLIASLIALWVLWEKIFGTDEGLREAKASAANLENELADITKQLRSGNVELIRMKGHYEELSSLGRLAMMAIREGIGAGLVGPPAPLTVPKLSIPRVPVGGAFPRIPGLMPLLSPGKISLDGNDGGATGRNDAGKLERIIGELRGIRLDLQRNQGFA